LAGTEPLALALEPSLLVSWQAARPFLLARQAQLLRRAPPAWRAQSGRVKEPAQPAERLAGPLMALQAPVRSALVQYQANLGTPG